MRQIELFAADEMEDGASRAVDVAGWPVLVARLPDGYRAVLNRCSHVAAALTEGRVRRGNIQCPKHGAMFNLTDGRCVGGAYAPLRIFPIAERDGMVVVEVPDEDPTVNDLPAPGI